MTVREAKSAARDWVLKNRDSIPCFAGAFYTGSIVHRHDDDPFPSTSDLDLPIVIDGQAPNSLLEPAAPLAQRKILHRGVVLERHAWPLEELRNVQKQLASVGASSVCGPDLILDPTGEIRRMQRQVSVEYAKERWVWARCRSAAEQARHYCDAVASPGRSTRFPGYASDLIQSVALFSFAALCPAVQIPCLAALVPFSFRRAFVTARELYPRLGAGGLYGRILQTLGSADTAAGDAEALLREYSAAFDCGIRVVRTRFYPDLELQDFCRPLVVGGAWELVRSGHHRESMCFVATLRSWMQNAIENDGSDEERRTGRRGYARMLSALGISEIGDLRAKAEALRRLLPELLELSQAVMEANPGIDRSWPGARRLLRRIAHREGGDA